MCCSYASKKLGLKVYKTYVQACSYMCWGTAKEIWVQISSQAKFTGWSEPIIIFYISLPHTVAMIEENCDKIPRTLYWLVSFIWLLLKVNQKGLQIRLEW